MKSILIGIGKPSMSEMAKDRMGDDEVHDDEDDGDAALYQKVGKLFCMAIKTAMKAEGKESSGKEQEEDQDTDSEY